MLLTVNISSNELVFLNLLNRSSSRSSSRFNGFTLRCLLVGFSRKKKKIGRNHHSLSFVVTCCHSLSLVVTCCTTRCTTLCNSLSLVIICCHSLYHSLSLFVTPCHSLLLAVPLVVTRCHLLSSLSIDVLLVCLFINYPLFQ